MAKRNNNSSNGKIINSHANMDKAAKSVCDILRRDKAKGIRLYRNTNGSCKDVKSIVKPAWKLTQNTSIERIVSDPKIYSGKSCIKGTRIPVHITLDLLAAGESFEGIKKAYPNIIEEDIRACLP